MGNIRTALAVGLCTVTLALSGCDNRQHLIQLEQGPKAGQHVDPHRFVRDGVRASRMDYQGQTPEGYMVFEHRGKTYVIDVYSTEEELDNQY